MRGIIRAYDYLLELLCLIVGVIVLASVVLVTMDVGGRYLFGSTIPWTFEVTEYALLFVPCLGMAWLARERGHVAIDTFVKFLAEPVQRALAVMTTAACALVCAVVTYYAAVLFVQRYSNGATYEQILTIPEYWVLWVIPFGFGLTTFEFVRQLFWPETYAVKKSEITL